MPTKLASTLNAQPFTWNERPFVRAEVPTGDNRGKIFTVAQPLAQRYQIANFFASGGMGLLLEGLDLRTQCRVLIKTNLFYDVIPYARVPRSGRLHQSTQVAAQNAGDGTPHPGAVAKRRLQRGAASERFRLRLEPAPGGPIHDGGSQGMVVQRSGSCDERERMFKRYVASPRHTMQVDFDSYVHGVRRELRAGCERARAAGFSLPVPARAAARGA